jgi:hypothetical protein
LHARVILIFKVGPLMVLIAVTALFGKGAVGDVFSFDFNREEFWVCLNYFLPHRS